MRARRAATRGGPTAAVLHSARGSAGRLHALRDLVGWLEANASQLAEIVAGGAEPTGAAATVVGIAPRDLRSVERESLAAMHDIYAQCSALNYRPTGILEVIDRHGGVGMLAGYWSSHRQKVSPGWLCWGVWIWRWNR